MSWWNTTGVRPSDAPPVREPSGAWLPQCIVVRPCPQVRLRNHPANGSKRVRVRASDRKRRGKVHKLVQTPAQECSGRGPGRFRRRCGARGQRKSEKEGKPQDFAPNRRHRSRRRPASSRKRAPNGSKRLQTAPSGIQAAPSGRKRRGKVHKRVQTPANECPGRAPCHFRGRCGTQGR